MQARARPVRDVGRQPAAGATPATGLPVVADLVAAVNASEWETVHAIAPPRLGDALRSLGGGSPDLRITVEWAIEHGDRVTSWCTGSGTHTRDWQLPHPTGSLAGRVLPATHRRWRAPWHVTLEVRDGRISDLWGIWEWLSILDQLGALRLPG